MTLVLMHNTYVALGVGVKSEVLMSSLYLFGGVSQSTSKGVIIKNSQFAFLVAEVCNNSLHFPLHGLICNCEKKEGRVESKTGLTTV